MLTLLNAIYASFSANGTLTTALPGGLHRDQAPEGTALPYAVSHVLETAITYGYFGACRTTITIRFSLFGVGHDATGTLAETFVNQFDDRLLMLSGSDVNDSVTRLSEPTPRLHRHDAGGNDVWEWQVIYEYGVTF
jgi:hypothetical protein